MAGELVPHVLPDGRTLMVPSYLAKLQTGMQPYAPFSGGFGPKVTQAPGDAASDFVSVVPDGQTPAPPAAPAPAVSLPTRSDDLAQQRQATLPQSTIDPSKLVNVSKPTGPRPAQQQAPGAPGSISDSVKEVGSEIANRRGPARPGGLQVSSVKQEVQPGVDLLPEQRWRYGLEKRPDLGQEVDPNAEQPTWGNADPVMRARKTVVERGAEKSAEQAKGNFEQQEQFRIEQSNAQKAALAEQSQMLDQQLGTIADRRARVASLQQAASDRAQEANSIEPRTRAEVWGSKGNTGRAMAVLAAVLGGFAGNHEGWDMVDKSVQDAVDDDRSKWERAQRAGVSANNDFERAMRLYGDPEMASIDVRNRKLANTLAMTQQQLSDRSLDATAKMRGQQLYQQTYDQYLQGVQQVHNLANGKVLKEEVTQTQRAATGGSGVPTKLAMLKGMAEATEAEDKILHRPKAGEGPKGAVILPDGSTAYAANDQEAGKAQSTIRGNDEVKSMVRQLQQLTATASDRVITAPERAKAEVKMGALIPKLHEAMGINGFRGGVVEMIHDYLGNPAAFARNPNANARLEAIGQQADENIQGQLKYLRRDPTSSGGTDTAAPPTAPGFREEGAD